MNRSIKDKGKQVVKACPAAAANHNTATIDMEQVLGGQLEEIEVEISVPATTALVATKTLTIKLQDSADDSSYADIVGLSSLVITGVTGNGSAATSRVVRLPRIARRYLQANIAVESAGGDITDTDVTVSLLF